MTTKPTLRPFRWGVATSAYQIEGATSADGRTPSIWDAFARRPGAIGDGSTADLACDHYRRMPDDVALIASLGADTYRFSVAWPRVQPHGRGPVNPAGIGFYDRLVDELLARGIEPWVTLYHWDLPQELEDAGGWPHRDTAHRFADYAAMVFAALADRVDVWTTINEPWCVATYGYADGIHAPGRTDFPAAMAAAHHLLLGHGLAVTAMRAAATRPHEFGITLNLGGVRSEPGDAAAAEAARRADGLNNRFYLDALRHGRYPADVLADLADRGVTLPVVDGDLEIVATPIDVLGVNYYFDTTLDADGEIRRGPLTGLGWPITADGLTDLLTRLAREYPGLPLVVTENGSAFDDEPDAAGFVDDTGRTAFLDAHVAAVDSAVEQGADVRGYFVWSLLDNFEWGHGYGPRFGIVRVDYATQQRIPKASARRYQQIISSHRQVAAAVPSEGETP
ncbi:beta-glucosidase [Allocatelliglobosispora scoriae]|uniref:Beta-glucosidase n=1 Tax=Allocatelliglobosispora scoriae TaxID=643052 RepID=A0A841BKA0_9ACTN|nr:GH1 family beta-glucosidase [Allocatelliglobosispora scoriae]MBB5867778.1 beta-glucosidase [Allocatelliglobosispora scoriae]